MNSRLSIIFFPLTALFLFSNSHYFFLLMWCVRYLGRCKDTSWEPWVILAVHHWIERKSIIPLILWLPPKKKQICFVKIQPLSPLQIRWNWGQSRLVKGKILVGLERHIYDYSHKRKPLTKQQWRHLELSARLLWSSKRYFVAKLYVFSIEYIAQILLEEKNEEFFLTKTGLVGVIEKSGK